MSAREELNCLNCGELFTDPKTLKCLHTFCAKCLTVEEQRAIDPQSPRGGGRYNVSCPAPDCHTDHSMETGDKSDLKTDYFLERTTKRFEKLNSPDPRCDQCEEPDNWGEAFCEECTVLLCKFCLGSHNRHKETKKHITLSLEQMRQGSSPENESKSGARDPLAPFAVKKKWKCKEHVRVEEQMADVSQLCLECKKMICISCGHSKHSLHEREFASLLIDKPEYKPVLQEHLENTLGVRNNVARTIDQLNKRLEKLRRNKRSIEDKVKAKFEAMQASLVEQREALLARVQDIYVKKSDYLDKELEDLETQKNEISRSLELVKNTLQIGLAEEILDREKVLIERMIQLRTDFANHPREPAQSDTFIVTMNTTLDLASAIGSVFTDPSPKAFTADDIDQVDFIQDRESQFLVTCRDLVGTPLPTSNHQVSVELRPKGEGLIIKGNVENNHNGTYTVTLKPFVSGEHTLNIEVKDDDEKVAVPPIDVHVSPIPNPEAVVELVISTDQIPQMRYPARVAVNKDNLFLVSDQEAHMLFVLNEHGQCIDAIGQEGEGMGEFQYPQGVAFLSENEVIVADTNNHRIQILSIDGTFIREFGKYGSYSGQFICPTDVAASQDRVIYVTDSVNQRIQYFQHDGVHLGTSGVLDVFNEPISLCLDAQNRILVAEHRANQFSILKQCDETPLSGHSNRSTPEPTDLIVLQRHVCKGLMNLVSITYDANSRYIFLTQDNSTVAVYTSTGTNVGSVACNLSDVKLSGIGFLNDSRAVVCDGSNNNVIIMTIF